MGHFNSKTRRAPQPVHDPAILLGTDAGVIVRAVGGSASSVAYEFNPRYIPSVSVGDGPTTSDHTQARVLVARSGAQNVALGSKFVYIKRPPANK